MRCGAEIEEHSKLCFLHSVAHRRVKPTDRNFHQTLVQSLVILAVEHRYTLDQATFFLQHQAADQDRFHNLAVSL